jgi:hypothetical protein
MCVSFLQFQDIYIKIYFQLWTPVYSTTVAVYKNVWTTVAGRNVSVTLDTDSVPIWRRVRTSTSVNSTMPAAPRFVATPRDHLRVLVIRDINLELMENPATVSLRCCHFWKVVFLRSVWDESFFTNVSDFRHLEFPNLESELNFTKINDQNVIRQHRKAPEVKWQCSSFLFSFFLFFFFFF